MAGQSFNKMFVMLPVMFAARKIDAEDPNMVNLVRIAYGVIQTICLLLVIYTYITAQKVSTAYTQTIYVPPPPQPFADPAGAKKYTQISYGAHVMSTARSLLGSTLFGMALTVGLHYYKGMLVGLTMQAVMGPLNLMENALVKALLVGKGIRPEDKIFEEKTLEEVESDAQIVNEQGTPVIQAAGGSSASSSSFEDVLLDTWDAGAKADIPKFLEKVTKANCNHKTKDDQWTPLMILAGLKATGTAPAIRKVVELGGNVALTDKEGWTALHWAAFHGSAEAARELSNNTKLLETKDKEGLTPLEMAKREKNDDVAAIYEAAMKDTKKSK